MMNSPPFQPLAPGDPLLVGGYRVLARMEASGRGWVYLATTDSGRRLAVWVVRPEALRDPVFRERFRKDMAAARRVGGRRVAPVVDFHADAPQPWVATEYVAGPSLAQVVVESGPLPARAVRILMGGIAEALRDIHAAGVVHGRLMPSSVLLAPDGPRVTGYGVAPAGSVDADILALGGVVFYAATGRQYEGDGLAECPPDVRSLLERCLADVPAERPRPEQIIASLEHGTGAPEPDWLTPEIVDRLLAHATFPGDPDPPPPVPEGEAPAADAPPDEPEHADEPPPTAETSTDAAETDAKHEDIEHPERPETPHAEEPPALDTEHADTPHAGTRADVPARAGGTPAADTPLDTGPS
ncbi:protein kinase domain-containing protein, partial [Actinomadura kijaniata]|uniref:protein kinase domain-containing protein n=1 Tax=Actinomadura kijaniata TaxID=46161 RepID=UPI003CD08B2E